MFLNLLKIIFSKLTDILKENNTISVMKFQPELIKFLYRKFKQNPNAYDINEGYSAEIVNEKK